MSFKKILSFVFSFLMLFCCTFFLTSCDNSQPNLSARFNLEDTKIKDMDTYTSIGAASPSSSSVSLSKQSTMLGASSLMLDTNNTTYAQNYKLVGFKNDNTYKEIEFENKNGVTIKQSCRLYGMGKIGRFLMLHYTDSPYYDQEFSNTLDLWNSMNFASYIVDLKTNNIYTTEFITNLSGYYQRCDIDNNTSVYNDDCLYFCSNMNNSAIYKLYIEDENLKIVEVVNYSLLSFYQRALLTDVYGNLFLRKPNNSAPTFYAFGEFNYVITANGKLKVLPEHTYIAIALNGFAYTSDGKKINNEGQIVDSSDNCDLYTNLSETYNPKLIATDGNTQYYAIIDSHSSSSTVHCYKVDWQDKINYTVTNLCSEATPNTPYLTIDCSSFLINNDRIYFLNDDMISYLDIKTLNITEINSEYVFKSFKLGYNDTIIFTAVNENLDIVTGTIDSNDNVSVTITSNNFQVAWVAPIKF